MSSRDYSASSISQTMTPECGGYIRQVCGGYIWQVCFGIRRLYPTSMRRLYLTSMLRYYPMEEHPKIYFSIFFEPNLISEINVRSLLFPNESCCNWSIWLSTLVNGSVSLKLLYFLSQSCIFYVFQDLESGERYKYKQLYDKRLKLKPFGRNRWLIAMGQTHTHTDRWISQLLDWIGIGPP